MIELIPSIQSTRSALDAERTRIEIVSQNLANANVTRAADGQPYKRKQVIFESLVNNAGTNPNSGSTIRVSRVESDQRPFREVLNRIIPTPTLGGTSGIRTSMSTRKWWISSPPRGRLRRTSPWLKTPDNWPSRPCLSASAEPSLTHCHGSAFRPPNVQSGRPPRVPRQGRNGVSAEGGDGRLGKLIPDSEMGKLQPFNKAFPDAMPLPTGVNPSGIPRWGGSRGATPLPIPWVGLWAKWQTSKWLPEIRFGAWLLSRECLCTKP